MKVKDVMDKEYLMLRSEIEENLKKQDQLFGTVISILGLTNVFSHISENVLFLFLILFLSTLLQLRMLEYRNIVYYISTYMVVFLEKDSDFKWETRLGKFKKEGYVYEDGKLRKKIINTVVVRFGRIIKHFIILGLVVFILLRIVVNVYKSYYMLWIKIVLYVVAGFLVNFRNENNDTYFIEINDFNKMISEINKKSFNIKDLQKYNAIYVESECKKVNHKYNVKKFISETHL